MGSTTIDKVCAAQSEGDYVTAIQRIYQLERHEKSPQVKQAEWDLLFNWGLDPDLPSDEAGFECILSETARKTYISQVDKKQLDRDVPRTAKWLTPQHTHARMASSSELSNLRMVLEAFIVVQNQREDGDETQSCSRYTQGLNGIALVLLKSLSGDKAKALQYLDGIANRLLPTLFHTSVTKDVLGQDNLARTTEFFSSLLEELYPVASKTCKNAGFETGNLATKWIMTMFSSVSLSGVDNLLGLDTVLACWDVSFLAGMPGVTAVVVSLFDHAQATMSKSKKPLHMEDIVDAITTSLRGLTPAIVYNGCIGFFNKHTRNHRIRGLVSAHKELLAKAKASKKKLPHRSSVQYTHETRTNQHTVWDDDENNRTFSRSNSVPGDMAKLPELEDLLRAGTKNLRNTVRKVMAPITGSQRNGDKRSNRIAPLLGIEQDMKTLIEVVDSGQECKSHSAPSSPTSKGTRKQYLTPKRSNSSSKYQQAWESYWVVSQDEENDVLDTARRIRAKKKEINDNSLVASRKRSYCTTCKFQNCKCLQLLRQKATKQVDCKSAYEWIQAWDVITQRYYYYSPLIVGYSQWETPSCGYIAQDGSLVMQST